MICSLTPLRFNSIKRSGERSNLAVRERIIAITVFSLNPARTSFITDALVNGCSADCAIIDPQLSATARHEETANRSARPLPSPSRFFRYGPA
jgi:hypothetical protein